MRHRIVLQALIAIVIGLTAPIGTLAQSADDADSTITVTGFGQASAPADSATIQLAVSAESFGPQQAPSPGEVPGEEERQTVEPIITALEDAGIPAEAITVLTGPYVAPVGSFYGPTIAIIRFEIDSPTAESISNAVDAAGLRAAEARVMVGSVDVSLDVEDCGPLLEQARQQALDDAQEQAANLADLAGVSTSGEIIRLLEVPLEPNSTLSVLGLEQVHGSNVCSPIETSLLDPIGTSPTAYDPTTEPEVTAYTQVHVTFEMSAAPVATPAS